MEISEELLKEIVYQSVEYGKNDGWHWEKYLFDNILKKVKEVKE